MYDEGFTNSMNIDISNTVVRAMQEKYRDRPTMKYQYMDGRAMEFDPGSYDAGIDKGTLDSILCGEGSTVNAHKMVSEVYRVLKPNGVYIVISYGMP
mmetsp:Transcript_6536/g.3694  ORF Transcript_6536/g.3694 Transcript_6536/m.3694 type:complete len:97 (+) Transcript_6536:118-408(+)